MSSLEDIYVITGASNGIGFECAKALARFRKGIIVLACRNIKLAEQRKSELVTIEMYDASKIIILEETLDLSEINSVRIYATALKKYLLNTTKGWIIIKIKFEFAKLLNETRRGIKKNWEWFT